MLQVSVYGSGLSQVSLNCLCVAVAVVCNIWAVVEQCYILKIYCLSTCFQALDCSPVPWVSGSKFQQGSDTVWFQVERVKFRIITRVLKQILVGNSSHVNHKFCSSQFQLLEQNFEFCIIRKSPLPHVRSELELHLSQRKSWQLSLNNYTIYKVWEKFVPEPWCILKRWEIPHTLHTQP